MLTKPRVHGLNGVTPENRRKPNVCGLGTHVTLETGLAEKATMRSRRVASPCRQIIHEAASRGVTRALREPTFYTMARGALCPKLKVVRLISQHRCELMAQILHRHSVPPTLRSAIIALRAR
jgi:hypothetical protein